jgi:hypothetical protein
MTILQGDFEEELRRMAVARSCDQPKLRDPCTRGGSPHVAGRYEFEPDE